MACRGSILVVDDDPGIRDALAECLADLGCTVVTAYDGVHAVELLGDARRPCLVLLDLNMPRLGGAGLAEYIRAHESHGDLPIVSMSAGAEQLEAPLVDCHLCKPFDVFGLLPLIERCCQDCDWLRTCH